MKDENNIITEGQLAGEFEGFDESMTFKFTNGQVWEQIRYKYSYHYSYMPRAKIVETSNGFEIAVESISETTIVERVK